MSVYDKIKEIEQEIARTQKNKATERHIGNLKARISRLRLSLEQTTSAAGPKAEGFEVKRNGDARISLVGFPSVGKSTLFNLLTNSKSKTAEHAFTTVDCIAGQISYNNSVLQILDLPGIIIDASKNKGRGKQVISVARTSDLILIVVNKPEEIKKIIRELNEMNIRINQVKKNIRIEKTTAGGIQINDLADNNQEMIKSILKEFKLNNCLVNITDKITDENLIDSITDRAVHIDAIIVFNKIDNLSIEQMTNLMSAENIKEYLTEEENIKETVIVPISSEKNWGIENLMKCIWNNLDLVRIYTKKKGKFPDLTEPVILRGRNGDSNTVKDLCRKLHKDFVSTFKGCLVWGTSVKFMPQRVGLSHVLDDEDVVQIYTS